LIDYKEFIDMFASVEDRYEERENNDSIENSKNNNALGFCFNLNLFVIIIIRILKIYNYF
jgi:hypothetical protein